MNKQMKSLESSHTENRGAHKQMQTLIDRLSASRGYPCYILAQRACGQEELLQRYQEYGQGRCNFYKVEINEKGREKIRKSGSKSIIKIAHLLNQSKQELKDCVGYVPFVPWLEDDACLQFTQLVASLVDAGMQVIVNCPLQNDRYEDIQGNRSEISALELKRAGLLRQNCYGTSLKQFITEFLPLQIRLCALIAAVLGKADLEKLKNLGYEFSSDVPALLSELHPLFCSAQEGREIRAEHMNVSCLAEELFGTISEYLTEQGRDASIPVVAGRITMLSVILLEQGELERSHQILAMAEKLIADDGLRVAAKDTSAHASAQAAHNQEQNSLERAPKHCVSQTEDLAHSVSTLAQGGRRAEVRRNTELELLSLKLFGKFEILRGGTSCKNKYLSRTKIRRLLSFLALNKQRAVSRDSLMEYLWPHLDYERAQKNLYTSWCMLAKGLGSEKVRDCPYIKRNGELYQLQLDRASCDVDVFEALAHKVLFGQCTVEQQEQLLAKMDALYQDSLVADIPEDSFISAKMMSYRSLMVDSLLLLTRALRTAQAFEKALYYARAAFGLDETREDVYRELMDTQFEAGQRTSAMQTYFSCKRYLLDELGILPSKRTTALYQNVLLDNCN